MVREERGYWAESPGITTGCCEFHRTKIYKHIHIGQTWSHIQEDAGDMSGEEFAYQVAA